MLSPELIAKIQKIYLKSQGLVSEVFSGEYASAFRGRGMEFEEVREYVPGDDIRCIDWNVSARMGEPYLKIFREEREQTLMLLIDVSASTHFGSKLKSKKELLTEVAAVLGYTAIQSNDKVGAIIFTDRVERYIPPKKGKAHIWRVISEILSFEPKRVQTDLNQAFQFLGQVIHRKAICVVLSDFIAVNFSKSLKVASLKHDVVAIIGRDILETQLPTAGLISCVDLETREEQLIDLSNASLRNKFMEEQKRQLADLMQQFKQIKVDSVLLYSDQDYIQKLLNFFRIREKRR